MGKPLLTDEMIERAKRAQKDGVDYPNDNLLNNPSDDLDFSLEREEVFEKGMRPGKSRLDEVAKRQNFRRKLNTILCCLFVILALIIYAALNW